MKKFIFLALTILLISRVNSTIGVDVSQPVDANTFSCMVNNGAAFAIVRGYCSYGGIDGNAAGTLQAAASQGMYHDSYHFPCIGGVSPQDQANDHVNYLGSLPGIYWIDVEINPSSGCQWQDPDTNCGFLVDLVKAFQARGVKVGIYASQYEWTQIFGAPGNCPYFTDLPLWYPHYDNDPSFNDFVSFAGWASPNIKQYQGNAMFCGAGVDFNFY